MKILIADDDKLSLTMLDRALHNLGYEVVKATDGQEAWEILQQPDSPQLIIIDWIMPEMDGIDVVRLARKRIDAPMLYVIMLTSHNTSERIVEGFEAGVDDYIIKPFDKYELIARIRVGERTINLKNDLHRQNEMLLSHNEVMAKDLELSKRFMSSLLPDEAVMNHLKKDLGYRIISRIDSCAKVGGDIISLICNKYNAYYTYLFDISGHGVAAALSASALNSYIRTDLNEEMNPSNTLIHANKFILDGNLSPNTHATAALMKLQPNGIVEFANAGHPPLIVFNQNQVSYFKASTIPLGMFDNPIFSPSNTQVQLSEKDTLVVVSDGFIELKSKAGKYFGIESLTAILQQYNSLPLPYLCNKVYQALLSLKQDEDLEDDCSFLAIRYKTN